MNRYQTQLRLGSEHVSMHRMLRPSTLFQLFQQAAIRHTEALGMGREKTLDCGLLWVVTRQSVRIARMPRYGEEITLQTWPGKTMHVLFPRYYEVLSASGEPLLRAATLWALVDFQTRRFAFPEERGIRIDGAETGDELSLPPAPEVLPVAETFVFPVPYSYVDINGHMNNARYLDFAEDHIPAAAAGCAPSEIRVEYSAEARLGAALTVDLGRLDKRYSLCGTTDGKTCFRMSLQYESIERPAACAASGGKEGSWTPCESSR